MGKNISLNDTRIMADSIGLSNNKGAITNLVNYIAETEEITKMLVRTTHHILSGESEITFALQPRTLSIVYISNNVSTLLLVCFTDSNSITIVYAPSIQYVPKNYTTHTTSGLNLTLKRTNMLYNEDISVISL